MKVRPEVEAMTGYVPGAQPAHDRPIIKLNTNESPLPPSPKVMEAITAVSAEQLRRYPEPSSKKFREAAANLHGVSPEQIIAGNGSDDILTILTRTAIGEGGRIASPWPTYSLYPTLTEIQGATLKQVPWLDGWQLPVDYLLASEADAIYLANPNAPSGTLSATADLERLIDAVPGIVLIDEAYADFDHISAVPLIRDNVLISRTLSKGYGLAGLRFGYAIGPVELIEQMHKVRDSYNCDAVAQTAATAAILDQDYAEATWTLVREQRDRLTSKLTEIGFELTDSHANFVFARHAEAERVFNELRDRDILIRYWPGGDLSEWIRITVGTREQNDALLDAIKSIVS